ncbi:hypothetical protein NT01EI_1754 [Edwardsiella ictaluri 93-146]|uniref:Uncharacterized protein n=1 Tax=Edwardsiella ictaluri (strain 93-146) TaxID=634503 RepID=C5BE13_EDWI9|nr:hypothetical protein NT01EI_1754 [Edwardsiella ictaluri 93-146]
MDAIDWPWLSVSGCITPSLLDGLKNRCNPADRKDKKPGGLKIVIKYRQWPLH